ncbi:MAG: hypothetical protein RQ801_15675, partial [Spirochaetaceae bacterium]|nr:hypothetical protein [Spirochaetaceae bacterium]
MSVVGHVGMENRSIRSNALLKRSDSRQLRISDPYQPGRLLSGSLVIRNDRDNRLAKIKNPVDGRRR